MKTKLQTEYFSNFCVSPGELVQLQILILWAWVGLESLQAEELG